MIYITKVVVLGHDLSAIFEDQLDEPLDHPYCRIYLHQLSPVQCDHSTAFYYVKIIHFRARILV